MSVLSFIICTVDEGRFAKAMESLAGHFSRVPFECVRIVDPASLAAGYNAGLAKVQSPYVVFCHDDIAIVSEDFSERLMEHLAAWDLLGVAGASAIATGSWFAAGQPYIHGQVVQRHGDGSYSLDVFDPERGTERVAAGMVLDGMFIAGKTEVARGVGFDETNFAGFHLYDLDFSLRAHLAGHKVGIARDLLLRHDSAGKHDAAWHYFRGRFDQKHLAHLSGRQSAATRIVRRPLADPKDAFPLFAALRDRP